MHQRLAPTNDPYFLALSDSIYREKCVVVVGAGLSRPDYPTWEQLIVQLQNECGLSPDEISGADFLDVAEAAKRKEHVYYKVLDKVFSEIDKPKCQMRYHRLARVPFSSFLTLNFDSVLLNTLALHRNVTVSEFPNLPNGHHGKGEIFHIHGRLGLDRSAANSKIVLTRSDFDDAYDPYEHRLHSFIQSVFLDHDVCFLGCNPSEPSMAKLLTACEKFCAKIHGLSDSNKPKWFLLWDGTSDSPKGLSGTGINLVRYPRKGPDYVGMDEILEYWGDIQKPVLREPGVQRANYRPDTEPGQ